MKNFQRSFSRLRQQSTVAGVSSALLCLLALSASRVQTQSYAAHFPSDTPATGPCSVIPMGSDATDTKLRSQRTQIVVTAAELGNTKRRITNLAFAPCANGLRSYGRIQIYLSHKTAGPLSTTFANNIVNITASPRVKAIDIQNYDWPNTAGVWNNIGLTRSFDFDPIRGDLLIDIVLRNADFSTSNAGMRSDTRTCVHASNFSPTPRTGALTMQATKIRLSDGVGYIDRFMTACGPGPLQLKTTGSPKIGGGIDLQIAKGASTATPSIGVILLGFNIARIGVDSACTVHVTPDLILWAPLTSGASPLLRLPIPNDASLVGGRVYFQGAQQDAANTKFGYALTDRAALTIGR